MNDHDKYRTSSSRSKTVLAVLVTALFYSVLAFGQKPEYAFYPEFRNTFTPKVRAENPSLSLTNEEIADRYAAKLRTEGVTDAEITRRTKLILTERNLLEADYWNRYYLDSNSNFNRAPNGFLKQMVEGQRREKTLTLRENLSSTYRLLSPEPFWLDQHRQVYSGVGADIVMESTTQQPALGITAARAL